MCVEKIALRSALSQNSKVRDKNKIKVIKFIYPQGAHHAFIRTTMHEYLVLGSRLSPLCPFIRLPVYGFTLHTVRQHGRCVGCLSPGHRTGADHATVHRVLPGCWEG